MLLYIIKLFFFLVLKYLRGTLCQTKQYFVANFVRVIDILIKKFPRLRIAGNPEADEVIRVNDLAAATIKLCRNMITEITFCASKNLDHNLRNKIYYFLRYSKFKEYDKTFESCLNYLV